MIKLKNKWELLLIQNGHIKQKLKWEQKILNYQLLLMLEKNGHNVQLLDSLEINLIVDLVGLMELLKHIMIDYVLKPTVNLIPHYQLLILPHVVVSFHVFLKDVTEDK